MYEVRIANLLKLITPPYVTVYCFEVSRLGTYALEPRENINKRLAEQEYTWHSTIG